MEGDEKLTVAGSSTGLTVTGTSVTLTDNDTAAMTLTASPGSVSESDGATKVTVTAATGGVTFKNDRKVTVKVGKNGDSAKSGTDYAAVADFDLTIAAGKTSGKGTFTLTPTDDTEIEGDETITVSGTATGLTVTGTEVTLEDDDFNIAAATTVDGTRVVEGETLVFTVTLDNPVKNGFEVTPVITGGTASAGRDYRASLSALSFNGTAGETKQFTVSTIDDRVVEYEERVLVSFQVSDSRVNGVPDSATGVILDNDSATVTVSDASAEEGEELTFRLALDNGVQGGFTARVVFTDGTAEQGSDYRGRGVSVGFSGAAGETQTFTVPTVEDTVVEHDERFGVRVALSGAPAGVTGSEGTGTIENDDEAVVTVSDARGAEGEDLSFRVTLDKAVQGGFTVRPVFTDETAEKGTDYTEYASDLVFAGRAGETQTFTVAALEDEVVEYDETFAVSVGVSGGTFRGEARGGCHRHDRGRDGGGGGGFGRAGVGG